MRRFTSFVLLFVFALGGFAALAQEKKDDKPKEEMKQEEAKGKVAGRLPAHWSKLGLSDKEKSELLKTAKKFDDQIHELQEKIDDLRAQKHDAMVAKLSDAQRDTLKKLSDPTQPKK